MSKILDKFLNNFDENSYRAYIAISGRNAEKHFLKLGETFSKDKESFDKVRERAIREKGVVMPNLNDKNVNIVEAPMHDFTSEDKKKEASEWAFSHLQTKDKNNLPTLSDGTLYTIERKVILKFVDDSSFKGGYIRRRCSFLNTESYLK